MAENKEDALYRRWRDAQTEEQRLEAEELLFRAIRSHAAAVVWQLLQESNDALVLNITGDALSGLPAFDCKSAFSTWVHAIAKKQATQEKRRRARYGRVFDPKAVITETPLGPHEVEEPTRPACPDEWVALMRFRDTLPDDSVRLLDGVLAGKDQNELAHELDTSTEAAQSRRRRLIARLNKYFGK